VKLRKKLSLEFLDHQAYKSTKKDVLPVVLDAAKYGATIASNGCSDVYRRPILNMI
jgi:hypothetical protein